jgi:actin related protein 2/3 complex subunit 5
MLNRNDIAGALTTILDDAPYGQNVDEAKVQPIPSWHVGLVDNRFLQLITLQTLLTILNSTKSTEISKIIKALSVDTQDTLMKYLYKGMAMPGWGDVSGSVLLGWHEKVHPSSCIPQNWIETDTHLFRS